VALNPKETPDQTGSLTVEAAVICATCHMRGKEVVVPIRAGDHYRRERRIVERIKDGDASPYPVLTTDGGQFRDDEVSVGTS